MPLRVGMLFDGNTERYGLLAATGHLVSALDRDRVEVVGVFLSRGPSEEAIGPKCDEVVQLDAGSLPRMRMVRGGPRGAGRTARMLVHAARSARLLAKRIPELDLDVVHAHYWHTFLIGGLAARAAGVRSVWQLHGGFDQQGWASWGWDELGGLLADRVFCISRWVQDTLPPAWRERSTVLYNGVPIGRMRRESRRGEFRQRYEVPEAARLVGAFGGMIDRKGFEYFVEAAEIVRRSIPDVYFALVGDAIAGNVASERLAADLRERVSRTGWNERFIFTGRIPDAWRCMVDFDVVAMPSVPLPGDVRADFGEGFGLVAAEAMAQGAAVVVTRCGAAPELVEDQRCGLVVPPRDAKALAAALTRLLSDDALRQRLARAGAARAAERFDLEWTARMAEEIYEETAR